MIIFGGLGDAKTQHDDIDEAGLACGDANARKIVASMKDKLVRAYLQFIAFEQRLVAATVGIRLGSHQEPTPVMLDEVKFNDDTIRWHTAHRVEYVSRESSHGGRPLIGR
jgi:hypothetical protein